MSLRSVEEIMQRTDADPSFRELLLKCPGAVLGTYALTREEKAALLTGDLEGFAALGIDAASARSWTALDGLG